MESAVSFALLSPAGFSISTGRGGAVQGKACFARGGAACFFAGVGRGKILSQVNLKPVQAGIGQAEPGQGNKEPRHGWRPSCRASAGAGFGGALFNTITYPPLQFIFFKLRLNICWPC